MLGMAQFIKKPSKTVEAVSTTTISVVITTADATTTAAAVGTTTVFGRLFIHKLFYISPVSLRVTTWHEHKQL